MKHSTLLYEKYYTKLEGIQEERHMAYRLTAEICGEGMVFGIDVEERVGRDVVRQASMERLSDSETYVRNLITFLFEHAVGVCTFPDILADLL